MNNPRNAPAVMPPASARRVAAPSPLMNPDTFAHMCRVGNMLSLSPLFPAHLRNGPKEQAQANGMLVMNMAMRLNEDPLTVAQNIYFVSGRPGWNTTYMISKANMHGVFKNPIDWEITGKGDALQATAFAELAGTGRRVEVTVGMDMAKKEGWTKNPKYQSMPEQMLRYRSAAFLIRLYCPEVMIGIPASVEIELPQDQWEDVSQEVEPARRVEAPRRQIERQAEAEAEGDMIETEAEAPKAKAADKPKAETKPKAEPKAAPKPKAEAQQSLLDAQAEALTPFASETLDKIKGEIQQGADLTDTVELWGSQLDAIREEVGDPVYAEIMQELQDEYDAAQG